MLKFPWLQFQSSAELPSGKTNHFSFPPSSSSPFSQGGWDRLQYSTVSRSKLSRRARIFPAAYMCCFIGECSFLLYSYPHPGRMELPLAFARHTLTCTAVAAVRSSPSTLSPHPSFLFLPAAIAVRSSSGPSCCCCCWGGEHFCRAFK